MLYPAILDLKLSAVTRWSLDHLSLGRKWVHLWWEKILLHWVGINTFKGICRRGMFGDINRRTGMCCMSPVSITQDISTFPLITIVPFSKVESSFCAIHVLLKDSTSGMGFWFRPGQSEHLRWATVIGLGMDTIFAGSEDSVSLELLVADLWSLRMKPTAEETANISGRIPILITQFELFIQSWTFQLCEPINSLPYLSQFELDFMSLATSDPYWINTKLCEGRSINKYT